jgi:hypothetical protein
MNHELLVAILSLSLIKLYCCRNYCDLSNSDIVCLLDFIVFGFGSNAGGIASNSR